MNRVIHTWYIQGQVLREYGMPAVVQALSEAWPHWRQAQRFQHERMLWFSVTERELEHDCWALEVTAHGSGFNLDIWSILCS